MDYFVRFICKSLESSIFAAPYVKVYLLDNGKCINKKKTRTARKTLDPLYQQQLQFEENPEGKVLQVTPASYLLILLSMTSM